MRCAVSFAGVILAAGASSRMGREKALLPRRGGTFLSGHIGVLRPVTNCVIVVAAATSRRCSRSSMPPAARILDAAAVNGFADDVAAYLRNAEAEFGIGIKRIAIDAPSDPKSTGRSRRQCEVALDLKRISCITTPSLPEFSPINRTDSLQYLYTGQIDLGSWFPDPMASVPVTEVEGSDALTN
jgi:hypothetical protein